MSYRKRLCVFTRRIRNLIRIIFFSLLLLLKSKQLRQTINLKRNFFYNFYQMRYTNWKENMHTHTHKSKKKKQTRVLIHPNKLNLQIERIFRFAFHFLFFFLLFSQQNRKIHWNKFNIKWKQNIRNCLIC